MGQNPDYASFYSDYAEYFKQKNNEQGGIPMPEILDASKLDSSIESLKAVDSYLESLHGSVDKLDQNQVTNLIV